MNVVIKREFLTSENKRLLEKSKKIDNIVETLKTQGAEQAEIDEVRAMMSVNDIALLASFNDHSNKLVKQKFFFYKSAQRIKQLFNIFLKRLELAEAQLEEAIFIFECYIYYHTVTPVIQTGRGAK